MVTLRLYTGEPGARAIIIVYSHREIEMQSTLSSSSDLSFGEDCTRYAAESSRLYAREIRIRSHLAIFSSKRKNDAKAFRSNRLSNFSVWLPSHFHVMYFSWACALRDRAYSRDISSWARLIIVRRGDHDVLVAALIVTAPHFAVRGIDYVGWITLTSDMFWGMIMTFV